RYLPSIGRFEQEDPSGLNADSNLFRYAENNPTDETDPTGLAAVGHHWVPISVLTDPEIRAKLSAKAYLGFRRFFAVQAARFAQFFRVLTISRSSGSWAESGLMVALSIACLNTWII